MLVLPLSAIKRYFLILFPASLILQCVSGFAQNPEIRSLIPRYDITKPDGSHSSWRQLNQGQPALIIYFTPDCYHCHNFTKNLIENITSFKDFQIIMITGTKTEYPYLKLLQDFSKTYQLARFRNITVGTEYPNYFVNDFYPIQTTPFVAMYGKSGNLIRSFIQPENVKEILSEGKKHKLLK